MNNNDESKRKSKVKSKKETIKQPETPDSNECVQMNNNSSTAIEKLLDYEIDYNSPYKIVEDKIYTVRLTYVGNDNDSKQVEESTNDDYNTQSQQNKINKYRQPIHIVRIKNIVTQDECLRIITNSTYVDIFMDEFKTNINSIKRKNMLITTSDIGIIINTFYDRPYNIARIPVYAVSNRVGCLQIRHNSKVEYPFVCSKLIEYTYENENLKLFPDERLLTSKGTTENWWNGIREFIKQHNLIALTVVYSFASAIVGVLQKSPMQINMWGKSSTGKTTLMKIARSVWGEPIANNYDGGYLDINWNGTRQKIADIVYRNKGIFIGVDDFSHDDIPNMAEFIYNISEGMQRNNRSSEYQKREKGHTTVLYNGENSVLDKIVKNSSSDKDGILGRLLEIQITKESKLFITDDDIMDFSDDDIRNHIDSNITTINELIKGNYGIAGSEFAEFIHKLGVDIINKMYDDRVSAFIKSFSTRDDFDGVNVFTRALKQIAYISVTADLLNQMLGYDLFDESELSLFLYEEWYEQVVKRYNTSIDSNYSIELILIELYSREDIHKKVNSSTGGIFITLKDFNTIVDDLYPDIDYKSVKDDLKNNGYLAKSTSGRAEYRLDVKGSKHAYIVLKQEEPLTIKSEIKARRKEIHDIENNGQ